MFLGFNTRGSQLWAGSEQGFQIFELNPSFRRVKNISALGSVSLAAIEERSETLVFVRGGTTSFADRVLVLYDLRSNSSVAEMFFEEPILNIKVNAMRLVVILEKRTHLFDWRTLAPCPQIATLSPLNSAGLGCLSTCQDLATPSYFAWPHTDSNQARGDLVVMDLQTGKTFAIPAHKSPIVCCDFAPGGQRIASCSAKGTVIRVFSNPQSQLIATLRRGSTAVSMYSLVFSPRGTMLAACSSSETIHFFKVESETLAGSPEDERRSFAKVAMKPNVVHMVVLSEDDEHLYIVAPPAPGQEAVLEAHTITKGTAKKTGEYRFR
jgi:WD40 repeat protein